MRGRPASDQAGQAQAFAELFGEARDVGRGTGQRAQQVRDALKTAVGQAMIAAGAQGDVRIVDGAAAAGIVEVANEVGAELVVVGTHGRTGLARLALGSVAEAVIRSASTSVLTVPKASSNGPVPSNS